MQQEEIDMAKGYRSFDEMMDEVDRELAARSRVIKCSSWIGFQLTRLWFGWLSPNTMYYKTYRFIQRRIRGFDDSDLWSLDHTILKFTLPRLQRFREIERAGWPGPEQMYNLPYEEVEALPENERDALNKRSLEEWDRMLDKMIRAIELQVEHNGIFLKPNPKWKEGDSRRDQFIDAPELKEEHKEGWDLFIKWFHALWD